MVPARKSSGKRDRRAATIAEKLDSEPPEVRIPRASVGYPNRSHSHRTAVASICASAGAALHTPTYLLMPVARKSATKGPGRLLMATVGVPPVPGPGAAGQPQELRRGAVGFGGILFQSITFMAPAIATAFSIPLGFSFAGGAAPLAVIVALIASL